MNIDFDRIEKIYGSSIINSIYLLKDDVIDNIKYFISLGFEDTEDIFERQVLIFICPKEEFRVKINNLIKKLGNNYIEEIENDTDVIIGAAGKAAHLGGVIAANTTLPVIGVPVKSSLEGMDALLSTVQMPPGIPVATVGIDGAVNAAILAAEILAVSDEKLAQLLLEKRLEAKEAVLEKNRRVEEKLNGGKNE